MRRQLSATLVPLVAIICGVFAGSAAASSGLNPTVLGGFPPQIGAVLTADLNPASLPGDTLAWETCGTYDINELVVAPVTSSTYTLSSSDTDVCALELDAADLVDGISDPIGPVGAGPGLSAAGAALTEGDTITVTQGAWGAGSSTPSDVWYDCNTTCQQTADQPASGSPYLVRAADVGSTIEVQETATSADGLTTVTVTTAPTGLVTATIPAVTTRPGVSGTAQIGGTLTASSGAWTIGPGSSTDPWTYTYQWERCPGGTCTTISSATHRTYAPVTADVCDTLEVVVTADVYGVTGFAYSDPTRFVPEPPGASSSCPGSSTSGTSTSSSPPPAPTSSGSASSGSTVAPVVAVTNPRTPDARGRLTAMMRWTFRYAPSYTQVVALGVENPAVASTIATRCSGKGCPFKIHRFRVRELKRCRSHTTGTCRAPHSVSLESEFHTHKLAVGTQVTVEITRSRDVGKYYRFIIRRRRAPRVKISCLAPGSSTPGKDCTTP